MVLTVENDVFLLGFVGVHHVDLLRDALQLLLGYGVTAVGEALWEELEGGASQSQGGQGEAALCVHPLLGTCQKLAARERGCDQAPQWPEDRGLGPKASLKSAHGLAHSMSTGCPRSLLPL